MAEEKRKHGLWWWIDRYRKSTAYTDMSLAEQGAYRNLLDEQRIRGGFIPNDERILAKVCGDALGWPDVRERVLARFEVTPDGKQLFNRTATEVNSVTDALSLTRAESGRRGYEKVERGAGGQFTGKATDKPPGKAAGKGTGSVAVSVAVVRSPLPLSVSENNSNNGPGADAPAADAGVEPPPEPRGEKPPAATKRTWLTRPGELWQARWGAESEPPWGEMSSAFSKPYKAFEGRGEVDELWSRWERFLAAAERAEWARPTRFIQGLGQWAADARPPTRTGPPARTSVGEQQLQEARKYLESKGKSR